MSTAFYILCNGIQNNQHMLNVFGHLCPQNFQLEYCLQERTKKIEKGKCVWHIYYRSNINIAGKRRYKEGLDEIIGNKPFGSKVVGSGRYANDYGIHVQLANIQCACPMDFDNRTTLIHSMSKR